MIYIWAFPKKRVAFCRAAFHYGATHICQQANPLQPLTQKPHQSNKILTKQWTKHCFNDKRKLIK